jgi:hypothetical protein
MDELSILNALWLLYSNELVNLTIALTSGPTWYCTGSVLLGPYPVWREIVRDLSHVG